MSDPKIMTKLVQILRDVLEDPDLVVQPDTSASTVPGWDSMKHVRIVMAVEERFGIRLTTREINRLRNVGDLATAIAHRIDPPGLP
jgi:acyl carrier protein